MILPLLVIALIATSPGPTATGRDVLASPPIEGPASSDLHAPPDPPRTLPLRSPRWSGR